MDYQTQLQQPEWLSLRDTILMRDKRCQCCKSNHDLQVHHKRYKDGAMAWEYDESWLITYCSSCHARLHNEKASMHRVMDLMQADELHELWFIHTQLLPGSKKSAIRLMREYSQQFSIEAI